MRADSVQPLGEERAFGVAEGREVGHEGAERDGGTHPDLAEAAAVILADPGRFDGPTAPLTAPDAFDLDDVAGILTKLTGRTIRRTVADDDEWAAGLAAHGAPEALATMLLGMFRAARRGEFSATSPTLGNLLGRPATPLSSFLEGVAAAH